MTKQSEIYVCAICGNVVEVEHSGMGKLVCCGQEMTKAEAKTADFKTEKHVPVIEKVDGGILVKVGSVPHPMADDHYIVYIEAIEKGITMRKYLKPGDAPEALFKGMSEKAIANEYCNKHGLWKK